MFFWNVIVMDGGGVLIGAKFATGLLIVLMKVLVKNIQGGKDDKWVFELKWVKRIYFS